MGKIIDNIYFMRHNIIDFFINFLIKGKMIDAIVLSYDAATIIRKLKKITLTVYSEWMAMDGYKLHEKEETKTLDTCRLNKCH